MRAPVHNVRSTRLIRSAPFLVPVAIVPLVLTGITGLPRAHGLAARAALERTRERLELHVERRDALVEFGDLGEVATIEALTGELRSLVPEELTDIEIFSAARMAARAHRVDLNSVRIEGGQVLEVELDGRPVAVKHTRVLGRATLDGLVAWVDALRAFGVPCAVSSFSVLRDKPTDRRFRFEVLIGAFHYTAASGDP